MPRILQDPTNVPCPDFAGAAYAAVRQVLSNNGQVTNDQAIEQLTTAWNQTHEQEVEAWNQQVQTELEERQEQARLAAEAETRRQEEEERLKDEEKKEQEKKRPKINDFDESKTIADHVIARPSQFAIGKLKSFNYVELWYFTDEGCAEAQDTSKAQSDDAYGITKVDDLVALKPVMSFKASRNAVPDADLTWKQMNVAKNMLMRYMDFCDWPQKHVQSFAHFYFNLELEPIRSRPHGEKVLIVYQAKARRQWHDDLSRGLGFNIAPINQKLLSAVAEEVWDMVRMDSIKKLDAIALSPALGRDRRSSRMGSSSSPSKRGRVHSPSRSRSRSRSHSPPRQRRRRYASPEHSSRDANSQGRRNRHATNGRGRNRNNNPSFFQGGTAGRGTSACAVCLGRHEHDYAKCSATKLWNGGKVWVRRADNGRLVSIDGLPICFSFQTSAGCSDTTHPSRHTCSGCGKSGHGAQQCPQVQKN